MNPEILNELENLVTENPKIEAELQLAKRHLIQALELINIELSEKKMHLAVITQNADIQDIYNKINKVH